MVIANVTGFETAIPELMHGMFEVGFAGSIWLVQTIVLLATLLIITRNTSDWGQLLLPSMIGWNYFGVVFPNIFYILAVMIFVISTLSVNIVTKVISAGMQNVGEVFTKGGRTKRRFERMNIKEEMEKRKDQLVSYDLRRKKDIRELQKQYADTLKEEDTATRVLLKKLKREEEIKDEKERKEKLEKNKPWIPYQNGSPWATREQWKMHNVSKEEKKEKDTWVPKRSRFTKRKNEYEL